MSQNRKLLITLMGFKQLSVGSVNLTLYFNPTRKVRMLDLVYGRGPCVCSFSEIPWFGDDRLTLILQWQELKVNILYSHTSLGNVNVIL